MTLRKDRSTYFSRYMIGASPRFRSITTRAVMSSAMPASFRARNSSLGLKNLLANSPIACVSLRRHAAGIAPPVAPVPGVLDQM